MKKRVLSLILSLAMLVGLTTVFLTPSVSAAIPDLNQVACYTAAQGNIARLTANPNMRQLADSNNYYTAGSPGTGIVQTGVNAQYSNAGGREGILRINDGTKNQAAASAWNNWGSAFGVASNPVYIVYNWGRPYTIEATRVEFTSDGNGYSSGTQVPRQAFLEYWNGTAWVQINDISRPAGDPQGGPIATSGAEQGNFVNDAHISGDGSISLANIPNWCKVILNTPVTTTMLRLKLTQRQTANNTNGIGVSEWEVFGVAGELSDADSILFDHGDLSLPSSVKANFALPLLGANGSAIAWESNNASIVPNGALAEVTPPVSGTISVTMTATLTKGAEAPMIKTFNVLVVPVNMAPYALTLKPDNLGIEIAETLYGMFFEDINHSLDGGLNAQMIDNGSFQQYRWIDNIASGSQKQGPASGNYSQVATTIYAWTAVNKNSSAGTATIVNTNPLTEKDILILPGHTTADYGRLAADYQDDYNVAINITTAPTGSTADNQNAYGIAANGYSNTAHYNATAASIAVNAGWTYNISFFVRGNYPGRIKCFLENSSSSLNSEVRTFSSTSGEWTKITTTLTAIRTENSRLFIGGDAVGSFNLDFVTMKAEDSKLWRGGVAGGLREDLAEAINQLNPKFMRFPGGCASEGMTRARQYFWKDGIYKNLEERRGMPNYWGYWNSNTLGFFEYFCFAEQLGAEPVPVISFGVTCQFHNGGAGRYDAPITGTTNGQDNLQAYKDLYLQDALDLIEFCNGDPVTTVWGAKRAEMGHPAPFNLKYVALGNENGGSSTNSAFWQRFRIMWDGIKAVYPDIEVITNSDYTASGSLFNVNYQVIDANYPNSIVDEHMYQSGDAFWISTAQARYNVGATRGSQGLTYDRSPGKPRVFVGEYSYGDSSAANNQHRTAVGEAAYITMLERNSDIVLMSCYAPIVCKNNSACIANWHSNMIYVDNTGIWRTPNYYSTVLFANNVGNRWLNSSPGGNEGTAAQQNARRMNYITRTDTGANAANTFTAPTIDTKTGTIYCKLVNFENTLKETSITIENRSDQWYKATWEYIWSSVNTVKNHESSATTHAEAITPIKVDLGYVKNAFTLDIPMWSVGALVLTPVAPVLIGVEDIHVSSPKGSVPKLPYYVPGIYEGGIDGPMVRVIWPSPTNSDAYQNAGEVVITGTVSGTSYAPKAYVNVFDYVGDTTGELEGLSAYVYALSSLKAGEAVSANVFLRNDTAADVPVSLIIALYGSNGKMKDVVTKDELIKAGAKVDSVVTLPGGAKDPGDYVKVFVWRGSDYMPVTPALLVEQDKVILDRNFISLEPFSLAQVTINDAQDGSKTVFQRNNKNMTDALLEANPDNFLYMFRLTFNIPQPAGAQPMNDPNNGDHWDEENGRLRGFSTGHYLTALANCYLNSTEDPATKAIFKAKIDYMIENLHYMSTLSQGDPANIPYGPGKTSYTSEITAATSRKDFQNWGAGFISAYPPDQFIMCELLRPYGTSITSIWAPYYTLHKILTGLVDVYEATGNEDALEIAANMGIWVYTRLSNLTQAQLTAMWNNGIAGEYGGSNEVFARLYAITGDKRYLDTAYMFDNTSFFYGTAANNFTNGLANNVDTIRGRHANTHLPQIKGVLQLYDVTKNKKYYDIAENFINKVLNSYMFSIGGVGGGSDAERFTTQPDTLWGVGMQPTSATARRNTCESCSTYNTLKIARQMFLYDQDAKYMDYYERALYNNIIPSMNATDAGNMYFFYITPGAARFDPYSYQNARLTGFSCCNGTALESHTKFGDTIYFHRGNDELFVNLYIPSTLRWNEAVTITQSTNYPNANTTTLKVSGSGTFKMNLRIPYWATKGFSVYVNDVLQSVSGEPSSYITLERAWADGDTVRLVIPMGFHLFRTMNQPNIASVFYGPVLLACNETASSNVYRPITLNGADLSLSFNGDPSKLEFTSNDRSFKPLYDYNMVGGNWQACRHSAYFNVTLN